jgi:hypothetical protein
MFIAVAFVALVALTLTAHAGVKTLSTPGIMKVQTLTLSADASSVDLSPELVGFYGYTVEIHTSADDAVTFTIDSCLGTELFTTTTTGATSGEISSWPTPWPITCTPTYTLSGLGSGTATVVITGVK